MRKLAYAFVSAVDKLNRFIGDYVGYLIIPMVIVICWEIISRKFFNKPTIWGMEMTWMIFAVYIIWSGGPSLLAKAQVRMDALYNKWKPRTQAIVDSATFICVFLFCAGLTYKSFEYGLESTRILEHSNTPFGQPLYHLKMIVAIGTVFLLLQCISDFVKSLWLAFTGEELKK